MARWRLLILMAVLIGLLTWIWATGEMTAMLAGPTIFAGFLVLGVLLLRRAYVPGDPTRGQVTQELFGCALVTLGVIGLIGAVTFLGR